MEGQLLPADASEVTSVGAIAAGRTSPDLRPAARNTKFVAATEWLDSGEPVVSVIGELDLATAPTLENALLTLSDHGQGAVIVNLAQCEFMDLRGLRVLLAARVRLERSNRPLVVVAGNRNLLRVFKITRVGALFAIYPSLAAAVEGNGHA